VSLVFSTPDQSAAETAKAADDEDDADVAFCARAVLQPPQLAS